tara:strand:+ start:360 stop:971 length:612 start_codon:yes stop_codon:yes gene_type:complete
MAGTIQYDVWAVTPEQSNTEYFKASASIASSGSIALLATNLGYNGTGYKVSITSNGAEAGKTFTITGTRVGGLGVNAAPKAETLSGPSATVVYSANYYTSIQSISVDASSAGGVKIGFGGDMALPRTRVKSIAYLSASSAGTITITAKPSNVVILKVPTGGDTSMNNIVIPPEGILTTKSGNDNYAVLTMSQVATSNITLFCG